MPASSSEWVIIEYDETIAEDQPLLINKSTLSVNSSKDEPIIEKQETTPTQCVKNALTIALVFLLAFTGFSAFRNLQSSLSRIGVESLSFVGIGAIVGSYMSPFVMDIVGAKGSIIAMWVCMACLIGANFYPLIYTIFPAGAIFGFMAGSGWTAQLTYTTNTAITYAKLVDKGQEKMVEISNGLFYLCYSSSQMLGNVISSVILHGSNATNSQMNATDIADCGVNFCPILDGGSSSQNPISHQALYTLLGVFIAGPTMALLVSAVFLDPIGKFVVKKVGSTTEQCTGLKAKIMAPLYLFKDVKTLLLVPALFYSGMEQVTMFAGFNEAYVSCALGVHNVGYIMVCWGFFSALSSFMSGILAQFLGRLTLCLFALVMGLAIQIFLFFWDLKYPDTMLFYIVSGLWGCTDGILQTQLSALLGLVFQDNQHAAFANFRMLSYLGFAITYAYSAVFCQKTEIYIVTGVISLSIVTYSILETIVQRQKVCEKTNNHSKEYEPI